MQGKKITGNMQDRRVRLQVNLTESIRDKYQQSLGNSQMSEDIRQYIENRIIRYELENNILIK